MFGFGLWELALLGVLLVAVFGLGRFPAAAREAGWLYGTLRRLQRTYPWLGKVPWVGRFFR